ncbi:MAG: DUF72 domain-containing protein [Candidatus Lindowbacteria bacterium]|nr:DUF72 domain-containing protein [Candidatus Lindowbacteria bacterium]
MMELTNKAQPAARIRVGVAGWYYPDWQGIVYPSSGRGASDHLRYLAGFVDVIEINNTFYRPPDENDVLNWLRRVRDIEGFGFTVKLWQRFTHSREERWQPSELEDFLRRIRPIFESDVGGALLAQFPHSFHLTPENLEYLHELVSRIENIPVVVEVRHFSWNNPEAFAALEEMGVSLCAIDQPLFRGSLKPLERVVGDTAYIRLHGRNKQNWLKESADRDERYDYLYTEAELAPWVARAKKMAGKAHSVYVIANNHFRGQAVCNALMFKAALLGRRVRAPATVLQSFPVLKAHASPDAPMQEMLF